MAGLIGIVLRVLIGVGASGGALLAWKYSVHQQIMGWAFSFLADVLEIADVPAPDVPPIADFIATAEIIVPVNYMFSLGMTYLLWLLAFAGYKYVMSLWR